MSPSKEQELQIDTYLSEFRRGLPSMSIAEQEDVVREISVHIRESAQEPHSSIDEILHRLGPAGKLASEYGQDRLMQRASASFSPLLILRATLELTKRGVQGLAVFLGVFTGYLIGGTFLLTAALKPIFPRQTGLWIGPGVFDFGIHEPHYAGQVHEVLGWWYIPVAFWLGSLFLLLTTFWVRRFLRHSKQRRPLLNLSSAEMN